MEKIDEARNSKTEFVGGRLESLYQELGIS
jgi:hypothetical protein